MIFISIFRKDADRTDFLLDCKEHGVNVQLTLEGNREAEQGTVLANMLDTLRQRSSEFSVGHPDQGVCFCVPKNWEPEESAVLLN